VIKKIFKNQFLEICRKRVWAIPENWKFSGQTVVTEARWDPKHWSNSGQTLATEARSLVKYFLERTSIIFSFLNKKTLTSHLASVARV
jgi:hypothetical protein